MTDPYLIAHKVRGEPAFDVAVRMDCPLCREDGGTISWGCHECDSLGYWFIIPTSGHRAYPYWDAPLSDCTATKGMSTKRIFIEDHPMPPDLPDHYPHSSHTPTSGPSLAERLGITNRPPVVKITRRL